MFEKLDIESNKCPYCKIKLEKIPSRKTKCNSCGNVIFKRTHPETQETLLVKDNEQEKIDKEISLFYFIKKWKDIILNQYELSEKEWKNIKKKSGSPFEKDHLFAALSKIKQKYEEKKEYKKASQVSYSMAIFVDQEGKNSFHLQKLSRYLNLMHFKYSEYPPEKVQILYSNNGCEECSKLTEKIFTLEEAIEKMPIPNKNCTHTNSGENHFCRCTWLPVLDYDLE